MSEGHSARLEEGHSICTSEWQMLSAILKANTVQRPVETGRKIQYSAPLRRVAKDQECSAYMINICTKYGFDILIISGSSGGHRRHTTDDRQRTDKLGVWLGVSSPKES